MDYKEKLISLINDKTLPIEQRKKLEEIYNNVVESEEERIRKEIIDFLIHTNRYGSNERCESWLAWLGKQGEQKPDDMSIKEKAHQIAWETSKHYDPLLSKESWCEMAALDMASWLEKQGSAKWCDEDEKQGKQKPADKVEPKFTVGDGF